MCTVKVLVFFTMIKLFPRGLERAAYGLTCSSVDNNKLNNNRVGLSKGCHHHLFNWQYVPSIFIAIISHLIFLLCRTMSILQYRVYCIYVNCCVIVLYCGAIFYCHGQYIIKELLLCSLVICTRNICLAFSHVCCLSFLKYCLHIIFAGMRTWWAKSWQKIKHILYIF